MSRQPISVVNDTLYKVIDRVNYLLSSTVDVTVGPASTMPSSPLEESLHISTDDNLIYQYRAGEWVMVGGSETIEWSKVVNKVVATASEDGLLSKEDFAKLQLVAEGATNVTVDAMVWDAQTRTLTVQTTEDGVQADIVVSLTHTHPATEVVEDATHRFTTDAEKSTWNAKETPAGAQAKADAVQTALTTHANDGVKHITAAERTAWNAKEDATKKGQADGYVPLDANQYGIHS